MKSLAVFCASRNGNDTKYINVARDLGLKMANNNVRLVYGGSNAGCMGALADAVMGNGGEATGVIPGFLGSKEVAHSGLDELITVKSMHERKQVMADRADAFLALPGGVGTLDETVEILSWRSLNLHRKPVYIYSNDDFFSSLISLFDKMQNDGFLGSEFSEYYKVISSVDELFS